MRVDGKVYRKVSVIYFALHLAVLGIMIAGCYLPFYNGIHLFKMYEKELWIIVVGLVGLAVGCYFAWRTIKEPYYSLAAFLVDIPWIGVIAFIFLNPTLGEAFEAWAPDLFHYEAGIASFILPKGIWIVAFDLLFILYMVIMLLYEPKEERTV